MKDVLKNVKVITEAGKDASINGVLVPSREPVYLKDAAKRTRTAAVKKAVAEVQNGSTTVWVPTYALARDAQYHRDPLDFEGTLESRRLETNFDISVCPDLLTSYDGDSGILYVVDGCRCLLAAVRKGIKKMPVRIFFGMSAEDEAEMFADQNLNRILVSPTDKHQAELVAQGRMACIVEGMCRKAGITVTTRVSDAQCPLRAIVTATNIVDSMGMESLAWIFGLMKSARWLDDHRCASRALTARFLRALANTYAEGVREGVPDGYLRRLVKVLRHVEPALIEAYGKLQNTHMSQVGYLTVVFKDIARGGLTLKDIDK